MKKRLVAHGVSWVFNPGCLLLVLLTAGAFTSRVAVASWLVILGLFALLGLVILLVSWARGMVLDADLMTPVNLRDRSQILLIFLSLILVMLLISFQMDQPEPLHAILVAALILGMIVAAITLVWKISLHMLGVGALATATILIGGVRWWPIIFLIPLVAWARLTLRRHTPLQVLCGTTLGIVVILVIFRLYGVF